MCERLRVAHRHQEQGAELISPEPRIIFKFFSMGGFPADTSTTLLAAFFSTRATWRTNSTCILAFETEGDVAEAAILARDCTFEKISGWINLEGREAAAADVGGSLKNTWFGEFVPFLCSSCKGKKEGGKGHKERKYVEVSNTRYSIPFAPTEHSKTHFPSFPIFTKRGKKREKGRNW